MGTARGDLSLVRQARSGDRASLDALAERVQEKVCRYLRRVTLDEDRAQDLTQETLVAVLESLSGLRQEDRFWPWVYRIATNKARQHHRHEARRNAVSMSGLSEAHLAVNESPHEDGLSQASRRELGELAREAMADISSDGIIFRKASADRSFSACSAGIRSRRNACAGGFRTATRTFTFMPCANCTRAISRSPAN